MEEKPKINLEECRKNATIDILKTLAGAVFQVFFSLDDDSSARRLTCPMIEEIVNHVFRSINEVDAAELALYYALPDFFTGKMKDEIYNQLMFDRLKEINDRIISYKDTHAGPYPTHGNKELLELISFIKNDCYEQIKMMKSHKNLEAEFIKKIPGFGIVGKLISGKIEYNILSSINKGLIEYFTAIYVYGKDIVDAKKELIIKYTESFGRAVGF